MIKNFQDFLNESSKIPVVSMKKTLGLCFVLLSLFVGCEKLDNTEKSWTKTMEVNLQVVAEGYDGHQTWFQPRVTKTGKKNEFSLLLQPWFTEISDYFGTYHEMRSTDGGSSWSNPISLVDSLGDCFKGDTLLRLADVNAQFHERTKTILAIGGVAEYVNGHQPGMVDKIGYFSCSSDDRKYSSYRLLEIPSGLDVSNAGYGCSQWVELPDGDILLPIQMWNKSKGQFICTIARCSFDGHKLCYKSNSNLLAMDRGRGLYELSLIEYMEHFYLTLRNDVNGMVSASKDGKYFSEPKEWKFDTDSLVNIENTQSHWVKSPWGLHLVYTSSHRKESENVFRGRAPLFIAQFDENKMCLLKNTERILVPNDGAQLGNFGALDIDESNSWVITSEATTAETQKVGKNNGRVIIAKIHWK